MGNINANKLARMVALKRGERGLKEIAKKVSISIPTLSRVEQGRVPDLKTYLSLCKWLEVSADYFVEKGKSNNLKKTNPEKEIVHHLRADKTLPKDVSTALIKMISLAYKNT